MKRWSFVFSRNWMGYLALVIVFVVGCIGLSQWQLTRREEARAEIERVAANWTKTPQPLNEVLPGLESFTEDDQWRPVTITGRYLHSEELLVRGRPREGSPGFEQLVPLERADGKIFLINRGWLPVGNKQDEPDLIPAVPTGEVTVTARLRASEPLIAGRSAPEGQIATINVPMISATLDKPMYSGVYGLLSREDPEAAPRPLPMTAPIPDEGPHLSYALQWLVFALLAFLGLGWAVRQEYRIKNADHPQERQRATIRDRRNASKPLKDAEIEDSILDSERS
ncbi:MAG: SURF1 family cytochrome oxidase biogenesis protein [Rhodoglobus sp.]